MGIFSAISAVQVPRRLCVAALLSMATLTGLTGCTALDATLPMRQTTVNEGSASTREDGLLLNIVRASQSEPLNFMTLSKYTGSGTLEASAGMTHNADSLIYDPVNANPNIVSTTAKTISNAFVRNIYTPNLKTNSTMNFDLAPLENQEFYAQFMSPLGADRLTLLVNAGISRELVFHSIVKAARMTHRDGREFIYTNDPSDDRWNGEMSDAARMTCATLQDSGALGQPFTTRIWDKGHANDCNYQKFLYFIRNAIQYGMTTEVIDAAPKVAAAARAETVVRAPKGEAGSPSITVVVQQPAAPAAQGEGKKRVALCFDRAIAQTYNKTIDKSIACGSQLAPHGRANYSGLGPYVKLVNPELRSPYSIFQYYGRMMANKTIDRVVLFDREPMLATGDRKIFTVESQAGDCFAFARHRGEVYCVPNRGAKNTKEVFTLLNVLVNLSLKGSSLPTTPSILVSPGG